MATISDIVGLKDKMMRGFLKSDDRRTDYALIRSINKTIEKPPEELGSMTVEHLNAYIAQESMSEQKLGAFDAFRVFDIPGAATMELPAQIKKHGLKKGAIRTGEALAGMREYEVPMWERLPVDVMALTVLGGIGKVRHLPKAKQYLTGKEALRLKAPPKGATTAERTAYAEYMRAGRRKKYIGEPKKQITGGRRVFYQPGRGTTKAEIEKLISRPGYQRPRYGRQGVGALPLKPREITYGGRRVHYVKPTPEQDFSQKARQLSKILAEK